MSNSIDIEKNERDLEKNNELTSIISEGSINSNSDDSPKAVNATLAWFDKLGLFLNAETRGIEIVPIEEKLEDSIWNCASMWFSANLVIAAYSLGALGITVFDLSFWQAVLVIIFFNFIGALPVAFFSIFGIKFGLRQMVLSKFLVGNFTMRLFAFVNCVACVGWGAVNIMASAQLLTSVGPDHHHLPPWAGCLILIIATIMVTFFGYKIIHLYEKYSWIPNMIIFIIIIARMKLSGNFTYGDMVGGQTTAGNVLSFGGAIFGFATGWTTYAADYTVYMKPNTNSTKVFFAILIGLLFPLIFTMILGAACATGTLTDAAWSTAYESNSIGGLVYSVLVTDSLHGFGQFCCVVLAMSTVANNIPNMYSIGLCVQCIWSPLSKIPRIAYTIVGNFITLAICIPAYYKFDQVMNNFMNIIGYYLAIYISIALSEHFIYRKGKFANYDFQNYLDPKSHAAGYASFFAVCCGLAGVVIGMDQVWYAGVIGKKIGAYGGDIGFELAFSFSFIGYNSTRYFEKKYNGR